MKKVSVWLGILWSVFGIVPFAVSCEKTQKAYTRYEIVAEYMPENDTLTGTLKITFDNPTENALEILKLQLYPNAYRKDAAYPAVSATYKDTAYPQGESYGEMVVSSVNGAKNWEIMGEDQNILYVFLEKALYPNEKVVLDIGFTTKFARVQHRTGVTAQVVNLGNFFPILCGIKHDGFYETIYYAVGEPFYSDCADYKFTLTVPKEYEVASTGEKTGEDMLESKKVYTMYASNVRDFAATLSKTYRVKTETANGKTLFYYYYRDQTPAETLALVKEAFVYFEKTFGAYPYTQCTLAETGLCLTGATYPSLTMLSDALQKEERTEAIVHSIAHQWWGAVVGSDQIENAWQDECLAEYATALFFEAYEKYGQTRESFVANALREYRAYYDVYGSVLGRTDTKMQRHLSAFVNEYEYRCLAYDKGVIMLDALQKSVGDAKFFAGLKKYYADNCYTIATPEHLIAAFEKTGLDARGFFESFLQGKTIL